MNTPSNSAPRLSRTTSRMLVLAAALAVLPGAAQAQSGKWVANILQIRSFQGNAELKIESRNDKQSKAKFEVRNSKREQRMAWDIIAGRCNEDGVRIAPQAAFTAVQTGMDGGGIVNSNIPKLESGKLYYVRIYEAGGPSPTDANVLGCANLSELP